MESRVPRIPFRRDYCDEEKARASGKGPRDCSLETFLTFLVVCVALIVLWYVAVRCYAYCRKRSGSGGSASGGVGGAWAKPRKVSLGTLPACTHLRRDGTSV